ncbi:ectoine/hydroxyectoine ABC transporter permease subunit EhuD [Ensifer adhaerens]|uniref:ectoine/hydroxyectoine ABC transporter permease subunit EhuD n=1 Tax=Ensifer adhaerens TaxID=106592 RepID=UPI000CF16E93|nr:ectoine/hydroxyectoine ABC transporter permease subunit EhuD [Ensifer adhaerens]
MNWDWTFAIHTVMPRLLSGIITTIEVTILAFLLAVLLGLPLMLLRVGKNRSISVIVGEIVEFLRSTPLLVQIFFLFYLLPEVGITLPPFATGVLAIGVYYAALCSEVFRAGFEAVPRGQWEACTALNLGRYRTMRDVIIPQMLPPIVPSLGNYLIVIFKETPLLSFVAVAEMMQAAKLIGAEFYRFSEAITLTGLLFLILSLICAALVRWVEFIVNRRIYR